MKKALMLISILPLGGIGQTIKTYNGTYEKGKATYQYYDGNDGSRIYHGTFNYQYEDFSNNYPYQTIKGHFKNGKKDGEWLYKYESRSNNFNSKIIKSLNYANDALDGESVYSRNFTEVKNGKSIVTINYKKAFHYKNGKPIGFFKIENFYPFKTLYQGYIDSLGFADGEWKIEDEFSEGVMSEKPAQKIQCNRVYKNGYLLSSVIIDTEKGNKIVDQDINNNSLTQIADTTLINIHSNNDLNIACYDEDGKDRINKRTTIFENIIEEKLCETSTLNNTNIRELISKNIPFNFYTKRVGFVFSYTGINIYKQLQNQISNYEKMSHNLASNISIPYTGAYQFLKGNNKNERYNYLKADTIINLNSTYNTLIENISKLKIIFNSINFASKNDANIPSSLTEFYNQNNTYLTLFNKKNSDMFVDNYLLNGFQNFYTELIKSTESAYNDFQIPATQLSQTHIKKLKKDSVDYETKKLDENYKKEVSYYDMKFSDIKTIRAKNKNFWIENTYVNTCSMNFKNKLDSITKQFEASSDIFQKNELAKNRDIILKNIKIFITKVSEITNLMCLNLENSRVVNNTYKANSKIDFDNISDSKNVNKYLYKDYLPLCFSDLIIANNPQTAIDILFEIEKIFLKTADMTQGDEKIKQLKKCKTRADFATLLLQ